MKPKSLLLSCLLAAGLLTGATLSAQEPKPAAGDTPAVHTTSLWERIRNGGWVMYPIGACSVFTMYLIGDGIVRLTNPKKALPPADVAAVRGLFRAGKYVDAYNYCRQHPSPFGNVARVGISMLGEGKIAVEEGIMAEMAKENSRMQTFISYLSVIGVCTPMIGLLGTVTGMIRAFSVLGSAGIGDPSQLSSAIGEVLTATASGLVIAIPAFTFYYFLRNRAARVLHDIQDTLAGLLRKMPYEKLQGIQLGDEELYAADPEWWTGEEQTEAAVAG